MNNFAVMFDLICICIVLLFLLAAAVSFLAGKIRKDMSRFHMMMETIDFLLLLYDAFLFLMIMASMAAILVISDTKLVDPSGFIIPMFLFLMVFGYLLAKNVCFGSIKDFLRKPEEVVKKEKS